MNKGSLAIANGIKSGTLYLVESHYKVGATMAIRNSGTKCWHKISKNSSYQQLKHKVRNWEVDINSMSTYKKFKGEIESTVIECEILPMEIDETLDVYFTTEIGEWK